MGWAEDFVNQQKGQKQAAVAGTADSGYLGGFVSSVASGFSEAFGGDPLETAVRFGETNPTSHFIGEALGGIAPYVAGGWASTTKVGAALLDGVMARTGLDAIQQPIKYAATKELLRYTPVELSRLGVGLGTTDDWGDYGHLLADVGLSTALTGGFGSIGGFFRSAGKIAPETGRVVGADLAFKPTFEYRMSKVPEAQVTTGSLVDRQNELFKEVFTERPFSQPMKGIQGKYVPALENGTPETDALVNTLFKPSGEKASKASLYRQPLMKQDGTWALDDAAQKELLGGLGMDSMETLAESAVYPRLITVNSERAAGTISKALDESAMTRVGDGVLMGREADGGLWVVAKRLKAGKGPETPSMAPVEPIMRPKWAPEHQAQIEAMEKTARGYDRAGQGNLSHDMRQQIDAYKRANPPIGEEAIDPRTGRLFEPPAQKPVEPMMERAGVVSEGDKWFIAKTDQPQRFIPEAHKTAQLTVKQWAKYRDAFRPQWGQDIFNADTDVLLKSMTPLDYKDLAVKTKQTWIADKAQALTKQFTNAAGIKDSAMFRHMAEGIYDVVAPTVAKEGKNSLYGRLFSTLRNHNKVADRLVNQIIGGAVKVTGNALRRSNIQHGAGYAGFDSVVSILKPLSHEDVQVIARVAQAQAPAQEAAKLTENGLISEAAQRAIEQLQGINKALWNDVLMPAFKSADLPAKFDLLEGYIMPRIFKGDWFVPVVDEAGTPVWLASGTLGQAKHEAGKVIEELNKAGGKYKLGKEYGAGLGKSIDQLEGLHDLVQMQMGKNAEVQEAVQRAMQRLAVERAGGRKGANLPNFGPPKSLSETRGGMQGSPNIAEYTKEDIIKATQNHYQQLLKFAGYSTWKKRWLPEAMNLDKLSPRLSEDLNRKAAQYMGFEGSVTAALNKALTPIFGAALGGKAATRIAQGTNELMYHWNLAIMNPTFALLNLITPLQTVAPWISYMTKVPTERAEKLMGLTLRYGSDGRPRGVAGVLHPAKVMWQSMKEMKKPDAALLENYKRGIEDGSLTAQMYEGFIGGQSKAHQGFTEVYHNAGGGVAGGWEFMKRASVWGAEKSEELSRIYSFTAGHILGRDMFGLEGDALYRFAQRANHLTMYGYSVIDRSRMFTGPVGSMFGLFKNWQLHYINQMADYASLAVKEGIWDPMLWQFGSALAIGGLGATPLKLVADGLASWHDNSPSSYQWMQHHWSESADELYFGLPAFFGASLQASSMIPGTDVRNDITSLSNFVLLERAKEAGKTVGDAWDYYEVNGRNPLKDPNLRDRLLAAYLPRAAYRAAAAVEGDYIKSMKTGYPQVRGVSPTSRLLYGLGLNQVEVDRMQVTAKELWADKTRQDLQMAQLGERLAQAQLAGDFEEMHAVVNAGVAMGLPMSSVLKSANTRLRREQSGDLLSRYDQAKVQQYLSAMER